jgi:integrase/recombinase XerC
MLHTGLRVNEICRLRRGHINGDLLEVWGVGDHYREVPLDATCHDALQDYLRDRDSVERGGARPTVTSVGRRVPQDHDSEYLFPSNRTDDRLTPRAIGFLIAKYARLADIQNLRPHDLRHRFGYRMAETMPLDTLAQIMGHDLPESALIYVKAPPKDAPPDSAD